ncbi:signal recognition particle, SRP9/SRP14 subunit, partial [Trichodelitschia bisporula]
QFLARLVELFAAQRKKGHGSVFLTQKRRMLPLAVTHGAAAPSSTDPLADLQHAEPLPLLVRASDGESKKGRKEGKKVKLSTVVAPGEVEGFFARYAEVCKSGMGALKKRDRSKRKKTAKKR